MERGHSKDKKYKHQNQNLENSIVCYYMKLKKLSRQRFHEVKSAVEDFKNLTFSLRGLKKTDGVFYDFVDALHDKYGHKRFRIYLSYNKDSDDMELWVTFFDKEAFDIGMRSFLSPQGADVPLFLTLPNQQYLRLHLGTLGMIQDIRGKHATSAIIAATHSLSKNE